MKGPARTLPAALRPGGGALLLALALALLASSSASAQTSPRTEPPQLGYYTLLFLSDPALHKELKLSDDQVKKVAAHREKWLAQALTTAAQTKERVEVLKASDKALAEILDAAQAKRLRQIVLQQLDSAFPARAVLHRMPEIADALKLTEAQKEKLAGGTRSLADVLDDAQKAKWKEMTGAKLTVALQPSLPAGPGGTGGRAFGLSAAMPQRLRYLVQRVIQTELKLSDEQKKEVAEIQQKWEKEAAVRAPGAAGRRKQQELAQAVNEAVDRLLQPAQMKRLRQIELQVELRGREDRAFTLPTVVRDLKLTVEQQQKVRTIEEGHRKALAALFVSGESYEAIARKVEARKKSTYEELVRALTDGQRQQLKDLIGAPFIGRLQLGPSPGGRGGTTMWPGTGVAPGGRAPAATTPIYLWISGMTFAGNKALHEELKLTEDQAKRLTEHGAKTQAESRRITTETRGDEKEAQKKRQELAQASEKALSAILKPEQLKRFKQVVLQQLDGSTGRSMFAPGVVVRVEEVVKELKLDEDQKKKVLNREATFQGVLNAEQKAKWKELTGAPFTGNVSPAFSGTAPGSALGAGGGFGPAEPAAVRYLQLKAVQDELRLTEAQTKKVAELAQKWRDFPTGDPGGREAYRKKVAEQRQATEKVLDELLQPKQSARLRQIELQQVQKRGLEELLAEARVSMALGLTEEQQRRIEALNEDARKTRNLITAELGEARRADEYTKVLEDFNQVSDKKLSAVLTEGQRGKLKELLGEPFNRELRPGRGRTRSTTASGISTSTSDDKPGALITRLVAAGAGARAGLKAGDRIVEVDGKPVKDRDEWLALLRGLQAGDKVEIVVEREGKRVTVRVDFGAREREVPER